MATQKQHFVWIIMLSGILMAALSRFLPHPPNFTPIAAMALFSGALFKNKKLAFIMPLAGMMISDVIFELTNPGYGFYASQYYVYGSLLLITLLGFTIQNKKNPGTILAASLASTVLFFTVTNFGTWLSQGAYLHTSTIKFIYPHTVSGLIECYVLALPFLKYSFIGDLFFCTILFGGYALLTKAVKLQTAKA
jgi:hypothetical protein